MKNKLDLFKHIYIDNKADRTLVLLHGTGGTEKDFLFLEDLLERSCNILSLRGNIDENGQARFFRRFSFGEFDQQNIKEESEKLLLFMSQWNLKTENIIFLGYSNGANMILATMFNYPALIKNCVLLHSMLPFDPPVTLRLTSHRSFVSYGINDSMTPSIESKKVISTLQSLGAQVEIHEYESGHEVTQKEIVTAIQFIKKV